MNAGGINSIGGGAVGSETSLNGLLGNGATVLAIRIAIVAFQFFGATVLANFLGASVFGLFSIALLLTMIGATLARLGLDRALTQRIATGHVRGEVAFIADNYRGGLTLAGLASFVVSIGLFAGADLIAGQIFGKPAMAGAIRLLAPSIVPLALVYIHMACLLGLQRVARGVALELLLHGSALPLFALGAYLAGPDGAAVAFGLACLLTLGYARYAWGRLAPRGDAAGSARLGVLTAAGWPLLVVAAMMMVLNQADTIILGMLAEARDAGHFYAASKIGRSLYLFPLAAAPILAARLAALVAEDRIAEALRYFAIALGLVFAAGAPVLAVILSLPGTLLGLFGSSFIAAKPALMIYAIGQYLNAAFIPIGVLLIMTGHTRRWRNVVIAAAAIYIGSVWFFTDAYGLTGTAIGSLVGIVLANAIAIAVANFCLSTATVDTPRVASSRRSM